MDYQAGTSNLRHRFVQENVPRTTSTTQNTCTIQQSSNPNSSDTYNDSKVDEDKDYILSGVLFGTLAAIILVCGYAIWSIYSTLIKYKFSI